MQNILYVLNILFSLLVIGSILLLSSVKSISAGYGFNLFGLFGILLVNIMFVSKGNINSSIFKLIRSIFTNNILLVGLIGSVSLLFTQNIIHHKKIVKRRIPKEYNTFSNMSSIINIFLFALLYVILNNKYKQLMNASYMFDNKQMYSNIFLLLLSLQYVMVIFQYIILNYYSTDG